jgi:hypothetical protein
MHELNNLQTEKSSLLLKIQDLEEKFGKLTHMLSIQKCPTNKTGLGYVASTSDIPSSSKIVFVKRTVPELPPAYVDEGKAVMEGEVPTTAQPPQKPSTRRKPPTCHHCGVSGHIRPKCPQRQA